MGYLKGLKENGGEELLQNVSNFEKIFPVAEKNTFFNFIYWKESICIYICLCKSSNKKVHLTVINVV